MPAKSKGAEAKVIDLGTVSVEQLIGVTPEEQKVVQLATILPNVSCHVDRKINMGNYESLGIGVTIYRPVGMTDDQAAIYDRLATDAVSGCYRVAADEINKRVKKIRAQMRGEEVAE